MTGDDIREEEVRTDAIRLCCGRIQKVVIAKPGRHWRNDRRLIVAAAVLSARIDTASADGQAGTRWLNVALEAVENFQPNNSAAYFQSALQKGLGDLDPVMHDRASAQMLWIQLTRRIRVPEIWLAERSEQARSRQA